jgi:hypothetical protein
MGRRINEGAAWYKGLTPAEAREVEDLETIIAGCQAALTTASVRRMLLQKRAAARVQHERTGEQRAANKRLERRITAMASTRLIHAPAPHTEPSDTGAE